MKKIILLALALWSAQLAFAQSNRTKAEVFIEVEDRGAFTVYLDNEFVGSTNGRFRFYDVYNASPTLSIVQGNKKIYSGRINVRPDERIVFSYSIRQGLRQTKELNLYRNRQYALDDFDDYAGAYNTGIVSPTRPGNTNVANFENLAAMVKKEAFDDAKTNVILAYTTNNRLYTDQLATLLQGFTTDDKKLSLAKSLWPLIGDPQQYFSLANSFTFMNTKDEFLNFIKNNPSSRQARGMDVVTFEQLRNQIKRESFDDNKTKLLQVTFQSSALSTAQLAELLKLYSFEDKALACAKLAYPYIADPQRYFTLKDVFTFKSNQDALLDFLRRQQ
ncbi:DUF4476 domain-containing protein [Pedobacter sp. KR3-3]|uniref:DUF4476 domain-containing protein n=1 Tax=Pedobacter albus TaxID=3113905 RepID=A0ABU7IBZ3_9SPHI|nr:DUF4476 domain-containing protein [Pedobacter sp. KR3-3]MEE1946811.1 DUF4476 domain-containing protein [Pedobacter sp. KR3-3]